MDEYMTMPRMYALTGYWIENPPTYLSIGGIIKAFGKGKKRRYERDARDADGFVPDAPPPVDKRGFPTIEKPQSITQAAQMLDGGIHRVRGKPRKEWTQ